MSRAPESADPVPWRAIRPVEVRALVFAAWVFSRQPDGARRLAHSLRVMNRVQGPMRRAAAALHDVIESGGCTLDDLRCAGFPRNVVRWVDLLTKRPDEDYMNYIRRLAPSRSARAIKLADLADNLAHKGRADADRRARYLAARAWLCSR